MIKILKNTVSFVCSFSNLFLLYVYLVSPFNSSLDKGVWTFSIYFDKF